MSWYNTKIIEKSWYNILRYKIQSVSFQENIKLYWFCLLLSDWYILFTHFTNFWQSNKISRVFSFTNILEISDSYWLISRDLKMLLFTFLKLVKKWEISTGSFLLMTKTDICNSPKNFPKFPDQRYAISRPKIFNSQVQKSLNSFVLEQ